MSANNDLGGVFDDFSFLPHVDTNVDDAESLLVRSLPRYISVPDHVMDWAIFAEGYCQVDFYGRRLSERVLMLHSQSSFDLVKLFRDVIESVSGKKFYQMSMSKFGGPGRDK